MTSEHPDGTVSPRLSAGAQSRARRRSARWSYADTKVMETTGNTALPAMSSTRWFPVRSTTAAIPSGKIHDSESGIGWTLPLWEASCCSQRSQWLIMKVSGMGTA
jgi:hypothetical protein